MTKTAAHPDASAAAIFGKRIAAEQRVRQVATLLAARNIAVMPLKGALLLPTVYRDDDTRDISDVDLLVPMGQLRSAAQELRVRGFYNGPKGRDDTALPLRGARNPLTVDLHQRLFGRRLFRLPTAELFARARVNHELFGAPVYIPDPLDMFAHAVGHFAKSRFGPAQRAHLRDFGAIAAYYNLHSAQTAAHLQTSGLARAARYALAQSGDPFCACVLNQLAPDPVGQLAAQTARRIIPRSRHAAISIAAAHALNHSLPAAGMSFALHAAGALRRTLEFKSAATAF